MSETLGLTALTTVEALLLSLSVLRLTHAAWRGREWIAPAYAVVGLATAAWLVVMIAIPFGVAGDVAAAALLLASGIHVLVTRAWRVLTRELVAVGLLTAGVGVALLGLLFLWGSGGFDAYALATRRFTPWGVLPVDSQVPFVFAHAVETSLPTHDLLENWNGSDRPPLQSGVILLLQTPVRPFFDVRVSSFAPSILAQLLWVPATFAMLRALRMPPRVALAAVAFTAIVPTMIVNSAYTWPKLLSAALVLAAITFLIAALRDPARARLDVATAAAASALALLAHGAAVFAAPLLIGLLVLVFVRRGRHGVAGAGLGLLAGLVVYLPWAAFQRFVDPPGDRLLKWHLAGVVDEDARSFAEAFADSYGALDLGEIVHNKLANVAFAFDPQIWRGLVPGAGGASRQQEEFFITTIALDVGLLVLLVLVVAGIVGLLQRRSSVPRRVAGLLLLTVPCLVFWCLAMFGPATTAVHQGTQVWLVILIAGPFAWLASRSRVAAIVAAALQAGLTIVFYGPWPEGGGVDLLAAGVLVFGVALGVAAARILPSSPRPVRTTAEAAE